MLLSCLLTISVGLNLMYWRQVPTTNSIANIPANDRSVAANNQYQYYDASGIITESETSSELVANNIVSTDQHLNLLIAKAEQFFFAHQFSQAIDYYQQVEELNADLALQIKVKWLSSAYQWLEQNQFSLLADLLQTILNKQAHDEDWLLIKIEWLIKINKPHSAILIYQDLIRNAFDYQKEEIWLDQLHQLANQHLALLKQQRAWQTIIDFCSMLLAQESNYPPFILAMSEAYIHLDQASTAIIYLDNIRYNDDYQGQIDALYRLMLPTDGEAEVIALTKVNEHFVVEALINTKQTTQLLIDTGASITVISNDYYQHLQQLTVTQRGRDLTINTAGGNQLAFLITIDNFAIGNFVIDDFEMVVMDLANLANADGLLGMNFLKEFKFELDQSNAQLLLSLP